MITKNIYNNRKYIIWGLAIFLMMYIFYTNIEPLMVNDPDDWTYIGYIRTPVPLWKNWNPAKIFPETFEGVIGSIAAFIVYPLCGDYIMSFTYTFAFIIAASIAIYVLVVCVFCEKIILIDNNDVILITLVFFCMHFLLFRQDGSQISKFLFTASNLNCFMNYLEPMFLSFFMGIWVIKCFLLNNTDFDIVSKLENTVNNKSEYYKVGVLLVGIYFTIFSNMASNIVFVAPCICVFVYRTVEMLRNGGALELFRANYWKRNALFIYTFVLELVCLIFEGNGGRADSLGINWSTAFIDTYRNIELVFDKCNNYIWLMIIITIIIGFILVLFEERQSMNKRMYVLLVGCDLIVNVYIILLFTRVGDGKIARSENVFTLLIYTLLIFVVSLAVIIKKHKNTLPIILLIGCLLAIYALGGKYEHSMSYYQGDKGLALRVNNNIIDQFKNADKNGKNEFELHIPSDGLGYYSFSGDRIANTLYKHKIVSKLYNPIIVLEDNYDYLQHEVNIE